MEEVQYLKNKSVTESDNKDEEHVCAPNDLKECKLEGQQDKILEVLYEDLNDAHEVSMDDEDECDDVPTGKLSTCAEDSFHNIVNQIGEEMPGNYEESTSKETDDKFSTEVNKEMFNYDEISKVEVFCIFEVVFIFEVIYIFEVVFIC